MSKTKCTKKATKPSKAAPAKNIEATKAARSLKATNGSVKKLSAIDAAAKVLGESKEPMNSKELIDAMAAKKLWSSPGGKTPASTLYSAIIREINAKGKDSRFKKTERGKFAAKA